MRRAEVGEALGLGGVDTAMRGYASNDPPADEYTKANEARNIHSFVLGFSP